MVELIPAWGQTQPSCTCQPLPAFQLLHSPAIVSCSHRQCPQSLCQAVSLTRHGHSTGSWRVRTSQKSFVTEAPVRETASDWSLYNQPELYDQIFDFRDIPKEVTFLFDAVREHRGQKAGQGNGVPALQSVLEIGCGPARHLLEAAEQGASCAVGIDSNPHMIRFAETLAGQPGAARRRPSFYCTDARELGREADLQEAFDLALLPLGTLSHALTNADACAWLRAARGCLREGGLLCIELAHPGDVFDGTLMEGDEWDIVGTAGEVLHVQYGSALDDFDPVTQVLRRHIAVSRKLSGKGGSEVLGEEVVEQRVFTQAEVELLCQLAGYSAVAGVYGDYDAAIGLQHEEAYRLVMLLKK